MRVVVAGAGVLGASIALELARAGVQVTLADPAPIGANASGIAAGMLAPVFESVFDERPEHFARLMEARDLWPAFAASVGICIERPGALAVSRDEAKIAAWRAALETLGAPFTALSRAQVARARPDLAAGLFGLAIEDDWRLDPVPALEALLSAAVALGAEHRQARVVDFAPGRATLGDGSTVTADALILATGADTVLSALAPELGGLIPIKGHILEFTGAKVGSEVVRFDGGYICPTPAGCLVGATMEPGRADTAIDPSQVIRLQNMAADYAPPLADTPATPRAGVRAATADGLPLCQRSVTPAIWLAVGARRNGWMWAPQVASALARELGT